MCGAGSVSSWCNCLCQVHEGWKFEWCKDEYVAQGRLNDRGEMKSIVLGEFDLEKHNVWFAGLPADKKAIASGPHHVSLFYTDGGRCLLVFSLFELCLCKLFFYASVICFGC